MEQPCEGHADGTSAPGRGKREAHEFFWVVKKILGGVKIEIKNRVMQTPTVE